MTELLTPQLGLTDALAASILVVDDEPANVKLLERTLRTFGYRNQLSTTDPRTVTALFQQHGFDLIILDLNMPFMDGFEVMRQLQALGRDDLPPILILTAQHDQEHRVRALKGGAHDYVTKPFAVDELLARVRNLLQVQLYHKSIRGRNQWLEERVRERTRELYDTRLQIVRRLGRAAEFRDNETGLHIVRMSKMSVALGEACGMSSEDCELLLNASPMHDIGKIGIPDQILLKPGKFEPHEWEIMKTHATIGAEILSGDDSELLSMARIIALSHHEKWDGSGYPYGLAGENIPLVGRIVAMADVFDALTSERPYKKAWTVEAAMEYVDANRGKHFDPQLVDLFRTRLPDILAIKETFAEPASPDPLDQSSAAGTGR
ncbi:MAG: two-component system response regulator [Hydrogenophilales bacterium 28-61-23]|nr:MAG: two-component system response regulator [Hydrogenophilales bacterium 28-61-23]